MRDPTDLTATAHAEAADKAAALIEQQQRTDDLLWLMTHVQGRRIVARILDKTGIRRTPFHTSGSVMSFNAGAQNIGLWLEGEIMETSFDGYVEMLKEFSQ